MTKLNIYVLLAASILSVVGCDQTPAAVTNIESKVPDSVREFLVPLSTMIADTTLFGSVSRDSLKGKEPVRAFTIRAVDLLTVLGIPASYADSAFCKHKFARVYLGYRKDSSFRLFILPVEGANLSGKDRSNWGAGKDMKLDTNGIAVPDTLVKKETAGEYVLDLNAPCPATCPLDNTAVKH